MAYIELKDLNFRQKRFFEIWTGAITWILITSTIWASYLIPDIYGKFLIIFIVLWFIKTIKSFILFLYSFARIQLHKRIDWVSKSMKFDKQRYDKLKHIIIIPFYKERNTVLEPLLNSLIAQSFDSKNIIVVLSSEAKEGYGALVAQELKDKYLDKFYDIWINEHILAPGEVAGKGSNCYSASLCIESNVNRLGLDKEHLTLTASDCDSIYAKNYFSQLSYKFLTSDKPNHTFWASSMGYMQNYWDLPYFSRIYNSTTSFSNIISIARPNTRFIHISSYSGSYVFLESLDFYNPGIVSDDFHTYFEGLFKFPEKLVKTDTIFTFMDSDACESDGLFKTFNAQFKQVERWSWGVEDIPYIMINLIQVLKDKHYNLKTKLYVTYRSLNVVFDHQFWPVNGVISTIGATFVLLFHPNLHLSLFWANIPRLFSSLFGLAIVITIIAILVSWVLRPAHPAFSKYMKKRNRVIFFIRDFILEILHWLIFPLISLYYGTIPALFSHTKLMLGKYQGFKLTEKK